jgi:hypothetical protein
VGIQHHAPVALTPWKEIFQRFPYQYKPKGTMYWIYLLPSTQQTIGYNGFTTTCFDSRESSSGYVQNLLVLAVLLFTVLEVVGRYEVVAVLTLI